MSLAVLDPIVGSWDAGEGGGSFEALIVYQNEVRRRRVCADATEPLERALDAAGAASPGWIAAIVGPELSLLGYKLDSWRLGRISVYRKLRDFLRGVRGKGREATLMVIGLRVASLLEDVPYAIAVHARELSWLDAYRPLADPDTRTRGNVTAVLVEAPPVVRPWPLPWHLPWPF